MSQSNNFSTHVGRMRCGRKKRRKEEDKCLVCGDSSIGINFGVHTCSPCKAFFRRNAIKLGTFEFICSKNGDCSITSDTRRLCNCCRLAKCFRMGMDRNYIRTEDEKLQRNQLIAYNRQKRAENKEIIKPVNLLKNSHENYSYLSTNDQTLLTNILRAYDESCNTLRYDELLKMPNDETLSLQRFMNGMSHVYLALVNYLRQVPQFTNLPIETKIALLKSNLNQIIRLNSALIIQATGAVEDVGTVAFKRVFPDDLYSELCKCVAGIFPFVYDPIFLKLIFIVLTFLPSLSIRFDLNQTLIHPEDTFTIQNIYIELLWRYILYRCSSYRQSVQLLTTFITRLLHSQIVSEKLSGFISKISPNQGNQLEPIMRAMWLDEKNK